MQYVDKVPLPRGIIKGVKPFLVRSRFLAGMSVGDTRTAPPRAIGYIAAGPCTLHNLRCGSSSHRPPLLLLHSCTLALTHTVQFMS